MDEQRKYYRAKIVNLLSYECLDDDGFLLDQGMGKILDISQGGLLMETNAHIGSKFIFLTSLDIKEKLIKLKCKVVYCREAEPKTFHTGVSFVETDKKIRENVAAIIKAFLKTKTA